MRRRIAKKRAKRFWTNHSAIVEMVGIDCAREMFSLAIKRVKEGRAVRAIAAELVEVARPSLK